jgi:hypothetical protein
MFTKGVTSCITKQKPTHDEFETCDHFDVTYESQEFDPHCSSYAAQKAVMTNTNGLLRKVPMSHPRRCQVCSVDREISVMHTKYSDTDTKLQAINKTLEAGILLASLKHNVNISNVNATTRNGGIDVATLGRNLGIGIEVAKGMRAVTTQRGVQSMIYSSLNRRRSMNDRHTRYHHLPLTCFICIIFIYIDCACACLSYSN